MADTQPLVGIIMGSQSDWPTMRLAADILTELEISFESKIVSAHRTPDRLVSYAKTARDRGLHVVIAGAGGAAHLPGMAAMARNGTAARRRPARSKNQAKKKGRFRPF